MLQVPLKQRVTGFCFDSINSDLGTLCAKPLEVIAICIPFLLVEKVDGTRETIDMRQCRIARTSPEFAKRVRKALAKRKKQG